MRYLPVLALLAGSVALASTEVFAPVYAVTMRAKYPEPYGVTTVTVETNQAAPPDSKIVKLEFVSEEHRVTIPRELLDILDQPQIDQMRLTWSRGPLPELYASVTIPFGTYKHTGKAQGYSRVSFVIVDGELDFLVVQRPKGDHLESELIRVKPMK